MTFFCCGCDCLSIAYRALQGRKTLRHLRDHCNPLVTNKSTHYAVCHRGVITSHIGKDKPLCLSESASPHRSTFFFFPFFCRNFSRQDRAIYQGGPFLKEPSLTAVSNRGGQRGVNGIYWLRSCSGKLELGKLINWDLFCGSQLPRTDCVGAACLGKLPEWRPVIFQSPRKSFSVIFKNINGPFPRSIHSFWLPTSNKKLYLVKKTPPFFSSSFATLALKLWRLLVFVLLKKKQTATSSVWLCQSLKHWTAGGSH